MDLHRFIERSRTCVQTPLLSSMSTANYEDERPNKVVHPIAFRLRLQAIGDLQRWTTWRISHSTDHFERGHNNNSDSTGHQRSGGHGHPLLLPPFYRCVFSFSVCRHTVVSDRGISAPRLSRSFLSDRSFSWRQYLLCSCARRWRSRSSISAQFIMSEGILQRPIRSPSSPELSMADLSSVSRTVRVSSIVLGAVAE